VKLSDDWLEPFVPNFFGARQSTYVKAQEEDPMPLSTEQVERYGDKWWRLIEPILSELTSSDCEFTHVHISSTFWTAMRDSRLDEILEELVEGHQIFIQDEWFVNLPEYLISEKRYSGDVVIDFSGLQIPVCLKDFCLIAKIAAIFYAKYILPDFKPWSYFARLDQVILRFEIGRTD
jgi:hypothetical protein